jgi:hypothetical protein
MMQNTKRSSYKGYDITTRWTEMLPLADRPAKRFNASFTVEPSAPDADSWQQFPHAVFDTWIAASENALTAARRSIDLDLAAA